MDMKSEEMQKLFDEIKVTYFPKVSKEWKFTTVLPSSETESEEAKGCCFRKLKLIWVRESVYNPEYPTEFKYAIVHELAHIGLKFNGISHNQYWRTRMFKAARMARRTWR